MNRTLFEQRVEEIGKAVVSDAHEGYEWVEYTSNTDTNLVLQSTDGVYNGRLGIGIFLSSAGVKLGVEKFKQVAREIAMSYEDIDISLAPIEVGPGAIDGIASWAYSLITISDILGDRSVLKPAENILNNIKIEKINNLNDIISGIAGITLVFIKAHKQTEKNYLDTAVRCGEKLIESSIEGGNGERYWKTKGDQMFTGFGHGNSGIAYALFQLARQCSGQKAEKFKRAGQESIRAESSVFNKQKGNWVDAREKYEYSDGWCYGFSGAAIARAMIATHSNVEYLSDELAACRRNQQSGLQQNDSLCHGNMARVEWLMTASSLYNSSDYYRRAANLLESVFQRYDEQGSFCFPFKNQESIQPSSLFVGLSGIGYTCLRLLTEDDLPSVLLLE